MMLVARVEIFARSHMGHLSSASSLGPILSVNPNLSEEEKNLHIGDCVVSSKEHIDEMEALYRNPKSKYANTDNPFLLQALAAEYIMTAAFIFLATGAVVSGCNTSGNTNSSLAGSSSTSVLFNLQYIGGLSTYLQV